MAGQKRVQFLLTAVLLAAGLAFYAPEICRGGPGAPTVYSDRLPEDALFCPLAGKVRRLSEALSGRPLVVFLTTIEQGADTAFGRYLADRQMELGPWFSWAGVLVGKARREEVMALKSNSPLRLENCYHDTEGKWWRAFKVGTLPAAVVINEDGYIIGRFESFPESDTLALGALLESAARACNLKGRRVHDFRLPEAGTGRKRSLLDVTGESYTMLFFLQTSCAACFQELEILARVRNRYRDRVDLVTIFHDSDEGQRVAGHLDEAGITPDCALTDPVLAQQGRYLFQSVPLLIVVGPDGNVYFSRKGYRSRDALDLATELDGIFWERTEETSPTPFMEARRIHREALEYLDSGNAEMAALYWERSLELFPGAYTLHAHLADAYRELGRSRDAAREYARYLASQPGAYDLATIRTRIRSLADISP